MYTYVSSNEKTPGRRPLTAPPVAPSPERTRSFPDVRVKTDVIGRVDVMCRCGPSPGRRGLSRDCLQVSDPPAKIP